MSIRYGGRRKHRKPRFERILLRGRVPQISFQASKSATFRLRWRAPQRSFQASKSRVDSSTITSTAKISSSKRAPLRTTGKWQRNAATSGVETNLSDGHYEEVRTKGMREGKQCRALIVVCHGRYTDTTDDNSVDIYQIGQIYTKTGIE